MKPFLDCNIWSINDLTVDDFGFFKIKRIYYYNSNTEEFNTPIPPGFIQIPEFEIKNLNLLKTIDFNFINKFEIPILRKDLDGKWTIDLTYYDENSYLQCTNNSSSN
jgi:hypothetical protein